MPELAPPQAEAGLLMTQAKNRRPAPAYGGAATWRTRWHRGWFEELNALFELAKGLAMGLMIRCRTTLVTPPWGYSCDAQLGLHRCSYEAMAVLR